MDDPFAGLEPEERVQAERIWRVLDPGYRASLERWMAGRAIEYRIKLLRELIARPGLMNNIQAVEGHQRHLNSLYLQLVIALPTGLLLGAPFFQDTPHWWPLTYMTLQTILICMTLQQRNWRAAWVWIGGFVAGALTLLMP